VVIEAASWYAFPDSHGCMQAFVRALASYISRLARPRIGFPVLTRSTLAAVGEQKGGSKRLVDPA
jgi:hypothetical protein